jgi:hypothetical protein
VYAHPSSFTVVYHVGVWCSEFHGLFGVFVQADVAVYLDSCRVLQGVLMGSTSETVANVQHNRDQVPHPSVLFVHMGKDNQHVGQYTAAEFHHISDMSSSRPISSL